MTLLLKLNIFLTVLPGELQGFWPPPYNIQLNQNETFVISELLESGDIDDVYQEEEEMIKRTDLERLNFHSDPDKYYRIHKDALKYNKKKSTGIKTAKNFKKYQEFNPDIDDPISWKAGFVDEHEKFIEPKNENGHKFTEMSDNSEWDKNLEKRDDLNADNSHKKDDNYDYSHLKEEYNEEIKIAKLSNKTVNYTEVKEEESVKDAVETLVDFNKTPRNCTEEETKGIGLGAVECFWIEINKPRNKTDKFKFLEKIMRIVIIWFIVYIVIAVPCWCQKGWCCCCCRCKICRPLEEINEVKTFFAQNPLGVYHDEEGNQIVYQPTNYEKYAQKNLGHALTKL